jgi:hypothetical protein
MKVHCFGPGRLFARREIDGVPLGGEQMNEFVSDSGVGASYEDDFAGRHVLRENELKELRNTRSLYMIATEATKRRRVARRWTDGGGSGGSQWVTLCKRCDAIVRDFPSHRRSSNIGWSDVDVDMQLENQDTVLFPSNRQSRVTHPPVDHELWSGSRVTRASVEPPGSHAGPQIAQKVQKKEEIFSSNVEIFEVSHKNSAAAKMSNR